MWSDLSHRWRSLFRREQAENDLDEELRFHLDQQISAHLRRGLSRPEAERRARLELGGLEQVKEACRQARGVTLLEALYRDARQAIRALGRTPGFTAVVVLSLSLGIGANTAIFSLLDAVLLRSLPVVRPDQLVVLARRTAASVNYNFAFQEYRALRNDGHFPGGLAAYTPVRLNVQIDGRPEPTASGKLVSGNYFSVLGVQAALGRTIGPGDDVVPDGHPVAVLGHGYWQRRFGGDPAVLGRVIALSGRPFTVIGVAPPGFLGMEVGFAPDLFVPVSMQPSVMPASENLLTSPTIWSTWLQVFGRLGAPSEPAAVAAAFEPLLRQVQPPAKPGAGRTEPQRLALLSAANGLSDLRRQFSQPLVLLLAISAMVLLISCANVANLMRARTAARQSELALRAALGAGRGRLVQQLLAESLVLATLGGACGLLFAHGATGLLLQVMSVGRTPIALQVAPDGRLLAFTGAVSLMTGLLFGLTPAWNAGRPDLKQALDGGGRAGPAPRPGKVLLVPQVALCVLLLFSAGLFLRSLSRLDAGQAAPDRERILVMRVEPRGSDQRGIDGTSERLDRGYRALLARVRALPGVVSASMASNNPTSPMRLATRVTVAGEDQRVATTMVYPAYFPTVGLKLLAGRDLGEGDLRPEAPLVALVNEAFARQMFGGQSVLGQRFQTPRRGGERQSVEIVGMVADGRLGPPRRKPTPLVYRPFLQTNTGRGQMVLHARIAGSAGPAVLAAIRQEVQRLDPLMTLFEPYTLAEEVQRTQIGERLIALLSAFFGGLALLLACLGLYGIVGFGVIQRTRELGIRMALGARRGAVVWTVLREVLARVLLGLLLGSAASIILGWLVRDHLADLLFGLTSTDPVTLGLAAVVMLAAAALAAFLPARRVARIDPMLALRAE